MIDLKRYRYRPNDRTFEAVQWDGTIDGAEEIISWVRECGGIAHLTRDPEGAPQTIELHTLPGYAVYPKNWATRELDLPVGNQFLPCGTVRFPQLFEPASPADLPTEELLARITAMETMAAVLHAEARSRLGRVYPDGSRASEYLGRVHHEAPGTYPYPDAPRPSGRPTCRCPRNPLEPSADVVHTYPCPLTILRITRDEVQR